MILEKLYLLLKQRLDPETKALHKTKALRKASSAKDLLAQEALFIISPGRSGSKNLTLFMERYTKLLALHAPKPWLATSGYQRHCGQISDVEAKAAFYAAREQYLKASYERQQVLFDGDCKNLPLIHDIAEVMPNAKFIHLVRNPIAFVKSGITRGYYSLHSPELMGHLEPKNSASMSPVEKIAWFWNEANLIAEQAKNKLGAHRVVTLKAEELFSAPNTVTDALRQLGLSDQLLMRDLKPVEKVNAQTDKSKLINVSPDEVLAAIVTYCNTYTRYYPHALDYNQ